MNHEDAIQNILQDTSAVHSVDSLKLLSLTIAIISLLPNTDNKDDAWDVLTEEQRHWRTFMNRAQRFIGSLLKKYSAPKIQSVLFPSGRCWAIV